MNVVYDERELSGEVRQRLIGEPGSTPHPSATPPPSPAGGGGILRQFLYHGLDDAGPVAGRGLADDLDVRVPIAVGAVDAPAPVGVPPQHQDHRLAHGGGQVGDAGVGRDHQVEAVDDGGGIGHVGDPG